MSPFLQTGLFLINILFGFYILVIMLRFILQLVRANFYNPVCQMLMTLTNPPLLRLRRYIPGYGGIDVACLVLMYLVTLLKLSLLYLLVNMHFNLNPGALLLEGVIDLVGLALQVFFWSILIRVILSWIPSMYGHPLMEIVSRLSDWLLEPVRRRLPLMSGFDLSPIVVIIFLTIVGIFFNAYSQMLLNWIRQ